MTADELIEAAIRLYGKSGWVSKLADALHRDPSSVYRWKNGQVPVPGPVAAAVKALLRAKKKIKT